MPKASLWGNWKVEIRNWKLGRDETSLRVGCLCRSKILRRSPIPKGCLRHVTFGKACLWHKLAEELSDMVWHDFDKWNKKVQNTVGYQIIRSSDSIAVNIAEGYGRYTPADRKKFYIYSVKF